jgi:hypothetical protein
MCAFVFAVFRGERVALLELDHALCSQDILGLLSSIRLYEVSFLLQRVLERDEALCSYTRARVAGLFSSTASPGARRSSLLIHSSSRRPQRGARPRDRVRRVGRHQTWLKGALHALRHANGAPRRWIQLRLRSYFSSTARKFRPASGMTT